MDRPKEGSTVAVLPLRSGDKFEFANRTRRSLLSVSTCGTARCANRRDRGRDQANPCRRVSVGNSDRPLRYALGDTRQAPASQRDLAGGR